MKGKVLAAENVVCDVRDGLLQAVTRVHEMVGPLTGEPGEELEYDNGKAVFVDMSNLARRDVTVHEVESRTGRRSGASVGVDKDELGTLGDLDAVVEVFRPLVKLHLKGVPMETTTGDGTVVVFSRVDIRLAGAILGAQEVEDVTIQVSPVCRVFEVISHLSGLAAVFCGKHPADGASHPLSQKVPQDAVLEIVALVCEILPFHKFAALTRNGGGFVTVLSGVNTGLSLLMVYDSVPC